MLAYCADQENGGIIKDCKDWKERRWAMTCAILPSEVVGDCDLFWWVGSDLHVAFYPNDREQQVKSGRAGGHKGGRPRTQNPNENPKQNPSNNPSGNPIENPSPNPNENPPLNPPQNPKRREEKVSEEKKREVGKSAPTPEEEIPEASPKPDPGGNQRLIDLVNSLRPEWQELPHLTYAEMHAFLGCRESLAGLSDDRWQTLRDYMQAKLPAGMPSWRPTGRGKFLEAPADVLTRALQWRSDPSGSQLGRAGPTSHRAEKAAREYEEPQTEIPLLNFSKPA